VSRAFSTLEGIGLSINEDYSILQECYPYLAKRLLTDNSPRARAALQAMLYGPSSLAAPPSPLLPGPWSPSSYADEASHNAYFSGGSASGSSSAGSSSGGGAAFAAAGVAVAERAAGNNGGAAAAAAAEAAAQQAAGLARRRARLGRGAALGSNAGGGLAALRGSGALAAASGGGGGGALQANKVVEMGQGFAAYTSATADADAGKGVSEALNSALDLLLANDADLNFVQEVRCWLAALWRKRERGGGEGKRPACTLSLCCPPCLPRKGIHGDLIVASFFFFFRVWL
jgi:hypothetical protein